MRWYFLLHGISCLLITKMFLFWIFWRWKILYFMPKSWSKYDIYWFLKNYLFWSFQEWEIRSFLSQNVDGKMIFTEKFLFWPFPEWEIRFFFWAKNLWKYDIYWLLKSPCFELFGDGKYGLFSAKMLIERWYLLGLFELSMIFQELGNMVFRTVLEIISIFQSFKNIRVDHQIVCNFLFFIQLPFPRN